MTAAETKLQLSIDQVHRVCDPERFGFKSTEELETRDQVIGQERALHAISFGIQMGGHSYHMFALGDPGTGKMTIIRKFLEQQAKDRSAPNDWCYVNNFQDSDRPCALRLPAGKGSSFQKDMDRLVEELQTRLPRAFESKEYEQQQEPIRQELQAKQRALFAELESAAKEKNLTIMQTPQGIVMAPVVSGQPLTAEQFAQH